MSLRADEARKFSSLFVDNSFGEVEIIPIPSCPHLFPNSDPTTVSLLGIGQPLISSARDSSSNEARGVGPGVWKHRKEVGHVSRT